MCSTSKDSLVWQLRFIVVVKEIKKSIKSWNRRIMYIDSILYSTFIFLSYLPAIRKIYGKYRPLFYFLKLVYFFILLKFDFAAQRSVMKSQNTDIGNLKRAKRSAIFLALPNRTEASKWAHWTRVLFLWNSTNSGNNGFGKSTTLSLWR